MESLPVSSVTPEIRVDCPDHLKFDLVKSELVVIANQQVAVNTFSGLVHTAI